MRILVPLAVSLIQVSFSALAETSDAASDWITDTSQWTALHQGEVVLLDSETGSEGHSATAAVLVDAPPSAVRAVVEDGDRAADFQESLVASRVVERTEDSIVLEQTVKVGLQKVTYRVRQYPRSPRLMDFELESGELKEMDGFWRYLPVSDEGETATLLVYRLSLKPLIPLPGFLVQKSIARNLPNTLRAVRDETTRRAANHGEQD